MDATEKKALPILTFPAGDAMGLTVKEVLADADVQSDAIAYVSAHTDSAAAVSFMDLSVEAECFGSTVRFKDDEVPTVTGHVIEDEDDAENLTVPPVGTARTGIYVEAIKKATEKITDRPVFAGMIGPFSLAARLFEVSEVMYSCYDMPEAVHTVLEKVTEFLTSYALEYKKAGANGIMLAEPVSGLLSPAMEAEFSAPYVKKIVDAVQDENFILIYHNCGGNTPLMLDSITSIGAAAYHFGNAVDIGDILKKVPDGTVVMGNIDPAGEFRMGTPESIKKATLSLLERVGENKNFIISSGCDIPPLTPWANIDAFFGAVKEYYGNKK
ncbi:MAG: uroporphyrinogen decarboxylase family protein [Clostridia bacterium]|nr:uroporphyrinogen decarboxylase family protein [Clostridia bacterium]